jgi:choline dehydrogenase-like flavoprotein
VRGDSLFDAVVVGAGAGGAAAAYGLCRRGLSVLLLDAGPRFDPPSDYSLTQADWDLRDFPQKPSQPSPLLPARNSATSRCWPRAAAVSDPL